jgi:hypothetical protein
LNKEKNLSTQKKKQLKTYNPAKHHRPSIRLKGYMSCPEIGLHKKM